MKTFQQWLETKFKDDSSNGWTTLEKEGIVCVKCRKPAYSFNLGRPLCKDCESKEQGYGVTSIRKGYAKS